MKYCLPIVALFVISFRSFSQTKIDINAVPQHIGDSIIVEGKISDTSHSQTYNAMVLQIAQPNGGSFDVVVKNENRNNFQFLSQTDVFNKYVRIIGKVISSNGRNRIFVTSGQQLAMVLGD